MPDEQTTQIPEMIERVALAIEPGLAHLNGPMIGLDGNLMRWDQKEQLRKRTYESARAAIEAMREPTHDICKAIFQAATIPSHPIFGDIWTASSVWQSGIDAALGKMP